MVTKRERAENIKERKRIWWYRNKDRLRPSRTVYMRRWRKKNLKKWRDYNKEWMRVYRKVQKKLKK